MPAIKYTWLFQLATNATKPNEVSHRVGGWSETWYDRDAAPNLTTAENWATKRAALLPQAAAIIGLRMQAVDPVGPGQSVALNFPGNSANGADIPQMALLCSATGQGVRNVRHFTLRGIPDNQVVEGEFSPGPAFNTALQNFFKLLKNSSWEFAGRDLSQVAHPILQIDGAGAIIFAEPHGLAVGNYVRILRTNLASKRQFGGRFYVSATTSPTEATVTGWTQGVTTGGKGRKDALVFPTVDVASPARTIAKKVGRPFNQYRGRASKRR